MEKHQDYNSGADRPEARSEARPEGRPDSRPDNRYDARPDRPARRPFTRQQDMAFLKDLDAELLRTIAKRTAVLERMKDKGRLSGSLEKELRVSWETKAYQQSKDNRLARDMFVLLQSLEPGVLDKEQTWFNLCPPVAPAEVDLHCPADAFWARCHMALAAACGAEIRLTQVPLGDKTIDCCKALNQLGASLWWENPQIINHRAAKGLSGGLDKVVHVGEDHFNFYLALALSLGRVNQIKFTGGKKAHVPGLSVLKSWLPGLGARLSGIVPGQDGLPVRLESSGMPPEQVDVDPQLPVEFICALFLAAPFWDTPIVFRFQEIPHLAVAITVMLGDYGAQVRVDEDARSVSIRPGGLKLLPEPQMPPDLGIAANFLCLPAFCSGRAQLHGHFHLAGPKLPLVEKILTQAGLQVERHPDRILTSRAANAAKASFAPDLIAQVLADSPDLFPLLTVLGVCQARTLPAEARRNSFVLPALAAAEDQRDQKRVFDSFLAQLDLVYDPEQGCMLPTDGQKTPAWLSPNAWWAMAYGWAALFRPNLLLVNPGVVTSDYPPFWNAYNSLPCPQLSRKAKEEAVDVQPKRRRIIAKGAYFVPPEQTAGDDD